MEKSQKNTPVRQQRSSVLFGFAFRQRGSKGRWQIKFRWGRIALAMLALVILAYCSFSTALFVFFKYRKNYEEANYWKMYTLLFNIDEHKKEMGEYQIRKAKDFLEEQDYGKAFQNLRAGVLKSPGNLEGRALLADFYIFGLKRPDQGIMILKQGVKYAHQDIKYLRGLIQVLLNFQEDQEAIELAEKVLATKPGKEIQKLLALGAATAHHFRGNFDKAEDFLRDYDLSNELDGVILSARINWDRGQKQSAIERLENAVDKFPNNEPIYAILSKFHRELNEYDKARSYAVLRNINSPLSVAPRIDLLYIFNNTEEKERAEREARAILSQFNKDEKSLLSLANYAADSGQIDIVRDIYEQALENDFQIAPFALLLIECHIAGSNFVEAINFTEELIKERPKWLERYWGIFHSLRAVAYYGVGDKDSSSRYLRQFLKEPDIRVESLIAVSHRFKKLNGKEEARAVLLQAYQNNPENQAALSQLISLEIDLGNSADLGGYLKRLLLMRRPSVELLEEAYRKLGSDRFIFTQDRDDLLIEINSVLRPS